MLAIKEIGYAWMFSYFCRMLPIQKFLDGQVLLINKPVRLSSFAVIKKVRYFTGVKKVGHAGTLDPLASGLLIVCTGKFTKRIPEFMNQRKEYTGSFTLGATTPTCDLESEPENFKDIAKIDASSLASACEKFTGAIMQVPPVHSAIKRNGHRVYELARKGIEVKLDPRPVTIDAFELTRIELPVIYFRVVCSTGTYIRSLARDFGDALGVGAYMSSLCRTKIGNYRLEDAWNMDSLESEIRSMRLSEEEASSGDKDNRSALL